MISLTIFSERSGSVDLRQMRLVHGRKVGDVAAAVNGGGCRGRRGRGRGLLLGLGEAEGADWPPRALGCGSGRLEAAAGAGGVVVAGTGNTI